MRLGIDAAAIALAILGTLVVVGTASSLEPVYGGVKAQLFIVDGLVPFAAGLVVALSRGACGCSSACTRSAVC